MKSIIIFWYLGILVVTSICLANPEPNLNQYPTTFEQWVRERVGPEAYSDPENDLNCTWPNILKLTKESKFQAIKTWTGPKEPGESFKILQLPHYLEICDTYPVVHLNICSGYLTRNMVDGKLDPTLLKGVEQDWYDYASYLYGRYTNQDKVFLFSVCAELNVYMGTEGRYPTFPVSEYVNTCQNGLERARKEFGGKSVAKIYSVAEVQCEVEYDNFIKKFVPSMTTDLYSLSFYCFNKDVGKTLDYLSQYAPPSKIFGKNNLMIGEFGPPIELFNWNETSRIRYYDTLLRTAYQKNIQFAFFYELADTEAVMKSDGHNGLYGWNISKPYKRPLWNYFYSINTGGIASVPTTVYHEPVSWIDDTVANGANLIVTQMEMIPKNPKPGDSVTFTTVIKNVGTQTTTNAPCVNFFVDDYIVSWGCLGNPLKPGENGTITSIQTDPKFAWQAKSGKHSLSVLVDTRNRIKETQKKDNFKTISFQIP